jgi:hypothetical protein
MKQNNLQTLQAVLTAMSEINTKGNDTIIMGQCLQAMQQVIQDEAADLQERENEAVEEE